MKICVKDLGLNSNVRVPGNGRRLVLLADCLQLRLSASGDGQHPFMQQGNLEQLLGSSNFPLADFKCWWMDVRSAGAQHFPSPPQIPVEVSGLQC